MNDIEEFGKATVRFDADERTLHQQELEGKLGDILSSPAPRNNRQRLMIRLTAKRLLLQALAKVQQKKSDETILQ